MKKHIIFSGLILSLMALMSCNGTYDDWADPQQNAQEDAVTIPGFKATAANAIDLGQVGDSVSAFTLSTAALPAGTTLEKTRMVITPQGSPKDETVSTISTSLAGKVDSVSLQNVVVLNYGRRPVARTYSAHVYADVMKGGQAMLVDAGTVDLVVTPVAPFIASAYYLVGDMVGWDADHMVKFNHSSSDVYEDPTFSIEFKTTGADKYWKIIPQTNVDAGNIWIEGKTGVVGVAVDGDNSMSGSLVTNAPKAGKISEPGTYLMTINMMDYSYTIERTNKYYMVGGLQNWNADKATGMTCLFYPQGSGISSYTTKWPGAWDLKIWDYDNFGNWDVAYGTAVDGDGAASGSLINSGAKSFQAPTKNEFYTLTINMGAKTYTWTKLENQSPAEYGKIGLVGEFNNWGPTDFDLTMVTPHNWYAKFTQTTTGSLKFRADGAWTNNWGTGINVGDKYYGTATNGGDNITVPAGTYSVYFNDITGEFAFVAD
jgi:hypothetical protein